MSYDQPDPYYQPEAFGLTIVAECDERGLSYEFNSVVLWRRDADGALFWAQDSGCSCPTPFEGYTTLESLSPLPETADALRATLDDRGYDGEFVFPDEERLTMRRLAGL